MFDRPKPTAGCSANGRRRIRNVSELNLSHHIECTQDFCGSFFPMRNSPLVGRGLLTAEISRSRSVGLLWTWDHPDVGTSTCIAHNTHDKHPWPPEGFEPAIPGSVRPQTHASERAVTGTGDFCGLPASP